MEVATQTKISDTLTETNRRCQQGCCIVFICTADGVGLKEIEIRGNMVDKAKKDGSVGVWCYNSTSVGLDYRCDLTEGPCANIRPIQH
jgi:hypothetical protein